MSDQIDQVQEAVTEQESPEVTQEVSQEAIAPKEINTFIDFEDEKWKSVPEHAEQVRARIARESREKADLRKQLQERDRKYKEMEEKLHEMQKPKEVQAPDIDLAYKDEAAFQRQQQEYIQSQQELAKYEAQQLAKEQLTAAETQRKAQERLDNFVSRGKNAGVDVNALEVAASVVTPHLQTDVREFLLDHEHGPQLLTKLQMDPLSLQSVAGLNSIQAGVKLNEMAQAYKRKLTSNAPPPDDPIQGKGAPTEQNPWLKGVEYL